MRNNIDNGIDDEMSPELFRKRYTGYISFRKALELPEGPRRTMIDKAYQEYNLLIKHLGDFDVNINEYTQTSSELLTKLGNVVMRIWFFGKKKELYEEIITLLRNERRRNLGDNGPSFVDDVEEDGVYLDFNDPDVAKINDLFYLASLTNDENMIRYETLFATQAINNNLTAFVDGMLSYDGSTLKPEEV